MAGRHKNKEYAELGYKLIKYQNKNAAACMNCKKVLKNTAARRLKAHRNVCKDINEELKEIINLSEEEYLIEYLDDSQDNALDSELFKDTANTPNVNDDYNIGFSVEKSNIASSVLPSELSEPSSSNAKFINANSSIKRKKCPPTTKKPKSISTYIDRLSENDEKELNDALAKFFFGCNIPLMVVDSIHFKNFIQKLRPAYSAKLPGRKALSTTLLDSAYDECFTIVKASVSSQSVLLIDGWKNCSNNSKNIVTMLHNANGEQAFLQAWDTTGESETAEKLAKIVSECIDIAKSMYFTDVYAVVSDNASAMLKMERITKHFVWHSNCSSHTANLFAKDVLNKDLTLKVISILKEFKQADFEKSVVDRGGARIKLPCDTRWCSYRDAYKNLIQNLPYMKFVVADLKNKKIKQDIAILIFNNDFIDDVQDNIQLMDPICALINKCQSSTCSVADAADMWLNLKLPPKFELVFSDELKSRKEMALNEYALTAYYLHPNFDNHLLNSEQNDTVCQFLFKSLNGTGIEEWDSFINITSFFKIIYEKGIEKPLVFWNMAEMKYPTLARLAKKLLQIPASSAQIEIVFSSWAHVHCPTRNRLTFERSKKLLYFYYMLRIKDDICIDDEF